MSDPFYCWKCGDELVDLLLPMSRREQCKTCHADQHVCNMCLYFQPNLNNQCDEERADPPVEKDRANFCDYFKPASNLRASTKQDKLSAAKAELESLFGNPSSSAAEVDETIIAPKTKKQQALDELNKLFGDTDK